MSFSVTSLVYMHWLTPFSFPEMIFLLFVADEFALFFLQIDKEGTHPQCPISISLFFIYFFLTLMQLFIL